MRGDPGKAQGWGIRTFLGDPARSSLDLEHYHCSCRVEFVVSHPFHKEREMDGARSFLTPSVKML
jgi:hypothetical protein